MSKSRDSPVGPHDGAVAGFLVARDGPGRLRLFGELDAYEVTRLRPSLAGADGDIELDCAGVTFIDAAGIGLFVALDVECRARCARLRIINPSRCVVRLLRLTDVEPAVIVEPADAAR